MTNICDSCGKDMGLSIALLTSIDADPKCYCGKTSLEQPDIFYPFAPKPATDDVQKSAGEYKLTKDNWSITKDCSDPHCDSCAIEILEAEEKVEKKTKVVKKTKTVKAVKTKRQIA